MKTNLTPLKQIEAGKLSEKSMGKLSQFLKNVSRKDIADTQAKTSTNSLGKNDFRHFLTLKNNAKKAPPQKKQPELQISQHLNKPFTLTELTEAIQISQNATVG